MNTGRENHLVELVDRDGTAVGAATVAAAHQPPGQLHRAFSVFLLDEQDRVLLQRRAAGKTRFPLRWANTCCGHPLPGESVAAGASRRLVEEVGVTTGPLTEVGVYVYYAEDPVTGRVEYEYDHVLIGRLPADTPVDPDPAEVADMRWVEPAELRDTPRREPQAYAPWLPGVADCLLGHLAGASVPEPAEGSGGR